MLQTFLPSFEWFLFPLSQKFIGIIEFPCLCKNLHWPHGKLIMFFFSCNDYTFSFSTDILTRIFPADERQKVYFLKQLFRNVESRRSKCHFRFRVTIISSLSTMYVFFFVTLFFCKEKKGAKECLTKQHLSGEKEGKVHLGGGQGYFCKKKIWPSHFLE